MRCRWGTKKIIITPDIYGNIIFNLNSLYKHCFCFVSGLRSLHNEGHEIKASGSTCEREFVQTIRLLQLFIFQMFYQTSDSQKYITFQKVVSLESRRKLAFYDSGSQSTEEEYRIGFNFLSSFVSLFDLVCLFALNRSEKIFICKTQPNGFSIIQRCCIQHVAFIQPSCRNNSASERRQY